MADANTDVLVAGYQGIEERDQGLRGARHARQGQEGAGRGRRSLSRTTRAGTSSCSRPATHLGRKGARLGRWRRASRRPRGAAAARLGRARRGRWRRRRQVRRAPPADRHPRQDRREPAARLRGRSSPTFDDRPAPGASSRRSPAAVAKSVVETDKKGTAALKDFLARGDGQVQTGSHRAADSRPQLRRHDGPHAQGLGRRLVDDPWTEGARGRAERAARSHRRRRLRRPRHVWRADPHADTSRACSRWALTYNRFHVTAVCSPTRAALLTGRNQHRVGFGSIAEYPGPFPGYTAAKPRSCAAAPAHSCKRTATSPAASASGT